MFKYINYLTIVLLPVYLIKITFTAGVSINLLDILLITSILFNFFQIFKNRWVSDFLSIRPFFKFALLLILFGYTISLFENYTRDSLLDSLGILKSFLFLPLLFSLSVSFLVHKKNLSLKYILISFVFMTSYLSFLGFFYFFLNLLTFDNRLEIFFNSPNALAMLLCPGILILIFFLNKAHGIYYSLFLTLLFFHTFSTIATSSSGGLFSLFILFIVFVFAKITKTNLINIYSFFIIFIFCFSLFLLFLPSLLEKTTYSQKTPPSSFDSRIVIYNVTRQIISGPFFLGIGPGNFERHYLLQQPNNLPYPQWAVPHPHNNLLSLFVEGGILVLLGYLILLLNTPNIKKMPFGILLVFILFYFLIHGLIDTTLWKNDLSVIFWLILGFLNFYNDPLFK